MRPTQPKDIAQTDFDEELVKKFGLKCTPKNYEELVKKFGLETVIGYFISDEGPANMTRKELKDLITTRTSGDPIGFAAIEKRINSCLEKYVNLSEWFLKLMEKSQAEGVKNGGLQYLGKQFATDVLTRISENHKNYLT